MRKDIKTIFSSSWNYMELRMILVSNVAPAFWMWVRWENHGVSHAFHSHQLGVAILWSRKGTLLPSHSMLFPSFTHCIIRGSISSLPSFQKQMESILAFHQYISNVKGFFCCCLLDLHGHEYNYRYRFTMLLRMTLNSNPAFTSQFTLNIIFLTFKNFK